MIDRHVHMGILTLRETDIHSQRHINMNAQTQEKMLDLLSEIRTFK